MNKAEKTRQFIVEKTAAVFNTKGYAGTSRSDIEEATGLSKGSIYGNFQNKDEVALAAFDYNYGLLHTRIKKRVIEKQHAVDKLRAYISIFSDFSAIPFVNGGCPVLNTAIEAYDTHPALRQKAVGAIERWYKGLETIIKDGQEAGQIKQGPDGKDFAGAFIALIEGGIMISKVTGKMHGLKAALKQADKMIQDITA
jgi:AcrR family transcriptional regulator